MQMLVDIVTQISNFFWGLPLLIGVVGLGLYFSFAFRWNQITKAGFMMKNTYGTFFRPAAEGEGTVSGFAAASTAIASTVGVGNIAGVATAITAGGPGAVFWLWLSGLLGMATKAAEIMLGQRYRVKFETADEYVCGINFVLKKGLGWDKFSYILAVVTVITSPLGLLVQTDAIVSSLYQAFGLPLVWGVILLIVPLAVAILGGIRRISSVAEKIVPLMALLYIGIGIYILIANYERIPTVFSLIFRGAFSPLSAAGGFAGSTVRSAARFGIARGVYSNEAGMGSGMLAHAAAITDHPARQAAWGFGEIFVDTVIVCTVTALSILITDLYISAPGITGAQLTTLAFQTAIGPVGGAIVAVGTFMFGWTTVLAAYYYMEKRFDYLVGDKGSLLAVRRFWMLVFLASVAMGYRFDTGNLWIFNDMVQIITVSSSLVVLYMLRKVVIDLNNDFYQRYLPALAAGQNPSPVNYASKP
ncbi:MAG: alanine/glycine:cation symporter family protein [bacterium]|jgi:AGCS family alanine or glycine:cation symporter